MRVLYARYLALFISCASSFVVAVTVINVTEDSIYFAVCYRKSQGEDNVRAIKYSPKEGCYTAQPAGKDFLHGVPYTTLPSTEFKWPDQACSARGDAGGCIEHYPRTVLFSFTRDDIIAGDSLYYNPVGADSTYLGKNVGSVLYRGNNVDGGETHFLYYNAYGFDPRYAALAKREAGDVVKAGKINSVEASKEVASCLKRYIEFMQYQYFGI